MEATPLRLVPSFRASRAIVNPLRFSLNAETLLHDKSVSGMGTPGGDGGAAVALSSKKHTNSTSFAPVTPFFHRRPGTDASTPSGGAAPLSAIKTNANTNTNTNTNTVVTKFATLSVFQQGQSIHPTPRRRKAPPSASSVPSGGATHAHTHATSIEDPSQHWQANLQGYTTPAGPVHRRRLVKPPRSAAGASVNTDQDGFEDVDAFWHAHFPVSTPKKADRRACTPHTNGTQFSDLSMEFREKQRAFATPVDLTRNHHDPISHSVRKQAEADARQLVAQRLEAVAKAVEPLEVSAVQPEVSPFGGSQPTPEAARTPTASEMPSAISPATAASVHVLSDAFDQPEFDPDDYNLDDKDAAEDLAPDASAVASPDASAVASPDTPTAVSPDAVSVGTPGSTGGSKKRSADSMGSLEETEEDEEDEDAEEEEEEEPVGELREDDSEESEEEKQESDDELPPDESFDRSQVLESPVAPAASPIATLEELTPAPPSAVSTPLMTLEKEALQTPDVVDTTRPDGGHDSAKFNMVIASASRPEPPAGTRRSTRRRWNRLNYWEGQRIIYKRRSGADHAEQAGVPNELLEPKPRKASRNKAPAKKRSRVLKSAVKKHTDVGCKPLVAEKVSFEETGKSQRSRLLHKHSWVSQNLDAQTEFEGVKSLTIYQGSRYRSRLVRVAPEGNLTESSEGATLLLIAHGGDGAVVVLKRGKERFAGSLEIGNSLRVPPATTYTINNPTKHPLEFSMVVIPDAEPSAAHVMKAPVRTHAPELVAP